MSFSNLIGLVPQEINLLDDSVVNNIAFAENDSEINISSINKISNELEFDEKLIKLLNDKDFTVGENGKQAFWWTKQKIVLARALYNNPEILILDEPTSAFDAKNRILFKKLINKYRGMKTVIIVSHDIDIIELSDHHYKI